MESPTIEVAAGLIFHNGRLLITQRYPDAHLGGLWEFPGGKVHAGESFEECLRRELREELGIEAAVRELVQEITHAYPEKIVRLRFFRCDWLSGAPQCLGCPAFAWLTAEQLSQYAFPDADALLLKKLQDSPKWWR